MTQLRDMGLEAAVTSCREVAETIGKAFLDEASETFHEYRDSLALGGLEPQWEN